MRVVVVGYRKGICQALQSRGIAYAVWDAQITHVPGALYLLRDPFPSNANKIKDVVVPLQAYGPFSHVIAGTESSVYPASVTRRILGARKSNDRIILACHDKLVMKQALLKKQIPMTEFVHGTPQTSADAIIAHLGLPLVAKERRQSGSRGTVFCHDNHTVEQVIKPKKLFEKFIDAPEASVESFIDNGNICFTNITEYYQKKHINIVPATFNKKLQQQILALNEKIIRGLNIQWGMTHMEVYLTKDGLVFGEIALRPPGGYIMQLISLAYGFNAWDALVAVELSEHFSYQQMNFAATAAIILHPGNGQIDNISGLELLKKHPAIKKIHLKKTVGETVPERVGTGVDMGYIILDANNKKELLAAIQFVEMNFRIEIAAQEK